MLITRTAVQRALFHLDIFAGLLVFVGSGLLSSSPILLWTCGFLAFFLPFFLGGCWHGVCQEHVWVAQESLSKRAHPGLVSWDGGGTSQWSIASAFCQLTSYHTSSFGDRALNVYCLKELGILCVLLALLILWGQEYSLWAAASEWVVFASLVT